MSQSFRSVFIDWLGMPNCVADSTPRRFQPQPRRAASIAAMSILFISIMASNARFAAAESESVIAFVRAIGVICQDKPHLSLHPPARALLAAVADNRVPVAIRFGLICGAT